MKTSTVLAITILAMAIIMGLANATKACQAK
jgi:hypothetical protein